MVHQSPASFCLLLHGHLPFVRHSEMPECLEEDWFFEAVTEVYLPLLDVFRRLQSNGVRFNLGFSLSPTLTAMLNDPLLKSRYDFHLDNLLRLAESECRRTAGSPEFSGLARMYLERFELCKEIWGRVYRRDLIAAFRALKESGQVELLTTAATHGFLPLMEVCPRAMEAQVEIGCRSFEEFFGTQPAGFWLPECGYVPVVEKVLLEAGVRYTLLETHGLLYADPPALCGPYSPVKSPRGLVFLGRDPETAQQVWSRIEGYPGDPWYRDFYRDIAFDLDESYLKPFLYHGGFRTATGMKYYRITGPSGQKEPYEPAKAASRVKEHAAHFFSERQRQANRLSGLMKKPPVVLAMYDAELFGHWWFEGPAWLEEVFLRFDQDRSVVEMLTPEAAVQRHPAGQTVSPHLSTWGVNGYNEMWLQKANASVTRDLHRAAWRMDELRALYPDAHGVTERALNHALREMLLAQASDWPFILAEGTASGYASERVRRHISRFNRLYDELRHRRKIDENWLSCVEEQDNPFPFLDYRVYGENGF